MSRKRLDSELDPATQNISSTSKLSLRSACGKTSIMYLLNKKAFFGIVDELEEVQDLSEPVLYHAAGV